MGWTDLLSLTELCAKSRLVVRTGCRQILVMDTEQGIVACANRCPHEGYPLSEGTLTPDGVLTCNWHNWKFHLPSGATLVGGDELRHFPVKVDGDRILLDLSEPPADITRRKIAASLRVALEERDEQRLVRDTARLAAAGLDPVDAVREAVLWAHDRLRYGMTHALTGAADWLLLHDRPDTGEDERLVCLGEILTHLAEDARPGQIYRFETGIADWNAGTFLAAVEAEDEATSVRLLRGALRSGLDADALEPIMVGAALAHYQSFGHDAIYSVKACALIRRLGADYAAPILLAWLRALIYGTREDLLPEFRDYARRHAGWGTPADEVPPLDPRSLRRRSAKSTMAIVAAWSAEHRPETIFEVMVQAAAWDLLHADATLFERTAGAIADNANWLDLTHELTFAEAGRRAVTLRPELWPALLLQQACFVGRNSGFVDPDLDDAEWRVTEPERFLAETRQRLFDHGQARPIISVHLLKVATALPILAEAVPSAAEMLYAGVNRFLQARIKDRHILRTARQMREFVARE